MNSGQRPGTPDDRTRIDEISEKWLQVCAGCDAGMGACSHPEDEDYRTPMAELAHMALRLLAENERQASEIALLNAAVNDLMTSIANGRHASVLPPACDHCLGRCQVGTCDLIVEKADEGFYVDEAELTDEERAE